MNPFQYTKEPRTVSEAQTNLNYWWYEGMECPTDVIEAHWKTYIKEMMRSAKVDLQKIARR